MPYRRLPNTDQARVRALKAAVEKGDVYNVRDLAISLKTLFEARNFLQRFEAAQIYYSNVTRISLGLVASTRQM